MSINAREKGQRGELDASKFLSGLGIKSRRGQQFSGLEGEDVVSADLPDVHWEVKRTEKLRLDSAMQQAENDAILGQIPAVLHKKNFKPWLLTIPAERMLDFARAILAATEVDDFFDSS